MRLDAITAKISAASWVKIHAILERSRTAKKSNTRPYSIPRPPTFYGIGVSKLQLVLFNDPFITRISKTINKSVRAGSKIQNFFFLQNIFIATYACSIQSTKFSGEYLSDFVEFDVDELIW